MEILENISLKPYNTFGIDQHAKWFAAASTEEALKEALTWAAENEVQTLVIGGGSNLLLKGDYNGLVLKNELSGYTIVEEDEDAVLVNVKAGEIWHSFVLYCLAQGYAGIENLALIPGCVGASPMQNIGAYGVEIKDVFHELSAVHRQEGYERVFTAEECAFGYRESVFKNQYKDAFVITDVTYRLRKNPVYHIEYGAIRQELERMGITELSIGAIAQAVINIRSSKLPDPAKIGNAGSFFKNPSVDQETYRSLKERFPGLVAYENEDGTMKLAAGWLIEKTGLKGYRIGDAGVHDKQALVIVNYGNATGAELLAVCDLVLAAVWEKFNIRLHPEVNII